MRTAIIIYEPFAESYKFCEQKDAEERDSYERPFFSVSNPSFKVIKEMRSIVDLLNQRRLSQEDAQSKLEILAA